MGEREIRERQIDQEALTKPLCMIRMQLEMMVAQIERERRMVRRWLLADTIGAVCLFAILWGALALTWGAL